MFLQEHEVNAILSLPYYTQPFTERTVCYQSYRGRANVSVLTLRFNMTPQFEESFMTSTLLNILTERYSLGTQLWCSIQYDVLLADREHQSFYIWRSNTNRKHFDENEELLLGVTHAHLLQFCQNAARFHVPDLDLYFATSDVSISKVVAIVFTFVVN